MTEKNDEILEDLEATNADEVTGGGPGVDISVNGQGVEFGENRQGGHDLSAAGANVGTRENRRGDTEIKAGYGDTEVNATVRDVD